MSIALKPTLFRDYITLKKLYIVSKAVYAVI